MREHLPPDAVVGIVAGGGNLPHGLQAYLANQGVAYRTIAVAGEAAANLRADAMVSIADIEGVMRHLDRQGVTHAVLIGTIGRRPHVWEGRVGLRSLPLIGRVIRALPKGDDAMLRAVIASFERVGVTVLGIHEVWPELLAEPGAHGRYAPNAASLRELELALRAARKLGELDVGQGAVAVGKRVVALEGLEGTDAMLERVAVLRSEGRLPDKRGGVLVKAVKPDQERRADLPTIGPTTIRAADSAKLAGIAVLAGATLIAERETTVSEADERGLFLWGIADE